MAALVPKGAGTAQGRGAVGASPQLSADSPYVTKSKMGCDKRLTSRIGWALNWYAQGFAGPG